MIKSYQPKNQIVQAFLWDGKQESFIELKKIFPEARPAYVNSILLDRGLKLLLANVGDVILVSNPIRILSQEEFTNEFEPIQE